MAQQVSDNTAKFVNAVNAKGTLNRPIQAMPGRRFDRLFTDFGHQRMCYAFIERATGDIYKAASWKAPEASAPRYLASEFDEAVEKADDYGSWLYGTRAARLAKQVANA